MKMAGPMYVGMYADSVASISIKGSAALETAGIKAYVDASGDTFKSSTILRTRQSKILCGGRIRR
ncbi:MAG: hypothetical protein ACLUSP_05420 [Christensenellales bacterium]